MDSGVLSKTSAYLVRLPLSHDEFMSPELLMNDDVTFKVMTRMVTLSDQLIHIASNKIISTGSPWGASIQ